MAPSNLPCFSAGLRYVAAPVPSSLPFGLFSVATMVPSDQDPHWQAGVQWESVACGPSGIYSDCSCNFPATTKTYVAGTPLVVATPFTVYGSFSCSPIGRQDDAFDRARAHLYAGEERAVELAIATQTTHTSQALNSTTTVDITPVIAAVHTPVTVSQGVAMLESYIGAHASGQGVILANRREVTLMGRDHVLLDPKPSDSVLYTKLLTPIGAMGGFDGKTGPSATAAAVGNAWLFALGGRPIVRRSDVLMVTGQLEDSLNRSNNNLNILAERTYVVGWDCFTAAIEVVSIPGLQ